LTLPSYTLLNTQWNEICAKAIPTRLPNSTSTGWCQPSRTLLIAISEAINHGSTQTMTFQCLVVRPIPRLSWVSSLPLAVSGTVGSCFRPTTFSFEFKYSARKPNPANAAQECPLGKDICASLTLFGWPVQILAVYYMAFGLRPGLWGGTVGLHTARKCGRRPPMNHLMKDWKRVAVARA